MTYNVFGGTLSLTQSINPSCDCMICDDFWRTGAVTLMRCIHIRRTSTKHWKRRRHNSHGFTMTFVALWRKSLLARTILTTTLTDHSLTSARRRINWPKWKSSIGKPVVVWLNEHELLLRSAAVILSEYVLYEYSAYFYDCKMWVWAEILIIEL